MVAVVVFRYHGGGTGKTKTSTVRKQPEVRRSRYGLTTEKSHIPRWHLAFLC